MQSAVSGISVIIPNYNGRDLLPEILPPLTDALQETGLPFEIIICDDASTDDSVSFIRSHLPAVTLLINEKNLGFSPTINKGIFAARLSHVLLLNSDVRLSRTYFAGLLRYFDRADTFGVMGKIIGWDDDAVQDGAKYPSFHGVKIKTSGNYLPLPDEPAEWLCSMYLSGANAFIDREKVCRLQGFNEIFAPFYVEDYELSLRAWRMGWKCYYDNNSVCRHQLSASIRSKSNKRKISVIYNRNKMYLHGIHLEKGKRLLWFLQLIPEGLLKLFGLNWTWFGSLRAFIASYAKVIESRKKFSSLAGATHLLTVDEVVKELLSSLDGKKIRRF